MLVGHKCAVMVDPLPTETCRPYIHVFLLIKSFIALVMPSLILFVFKFIKIPPQNEYRSPFMSPLLNMYNVCIYIQKLRHFQLF